MAIVQIPIDNTLDQRVRVLIGERRFTFSLKWNSLLSFWTMGISSDSTLLVSGKNLTGGVELINQYNLPFRNIYAVNLVDSSKEMVLSDTGKTSILVLVSDEDIELLRPEEEE